MVIGKVVGTVTSSSISVDIEGARYLLIDKTNQKGERKGEFIVALDFIGAGYDELVFISESTSARETSVTINKPIDALIVGIIDLIDDHETIVYKK